MSMTAKDIATGAIAHWEYLAHVLSVPQSEDDHERLVAVLDEVLDAGGADETSMLATLAERIGDLIEAYEAARYPIPDAKPVDVLAFLMEQHGLKQADLPEIGAQSVVSDVLGGKAVAQPSSSIGVVEAVRNLGGCLHRIGVAAIEW